MLVKIEDIKNLVALEDKEMVLLIANDPTEVGGSFQNTSICAQNKNLLDNGIISLDKEKECIGVADTAFVTQEGVSIFNISCYETFIRNKDIPFLFSDFVTMCIMNGYDAFRCMVQNNEADRIIVLTFTTPIGIIGVNPKEVRVLSTEILKKFMDELIPFLDSITDTTPVRDSLDNFGYEIIPFKDDGSEKYFIEIDPVNQSVDLKIVNTKDK